ncbi:4-hydroxythreonine-4-phosphate dehydrogenase [Flavobacterium sp. 316]|uniref:4-hydroxythreonine-4-phosphate dehydrogenase PdxA n=1 Tax=Flavobacterium sediminilitoris TaxID=2024526 RepID=A0ABY4HPA2_9FLAO|nr:MULTISPECIES: 4-hydroxythreonine-4-phosphate dehydrogenase PdxA [Flavobacterium]KIX20736.1 4-hydroxythreonine-4-phosphate dehydrogenase [Flavobacterium sp. 316]UOX34694.1 4-hydroxythreonine-4-phosphate dehydrogenase PdxA [Flavobacterium sediminilitoris]
MVKRTENIIVGISIGDLNGIGPEVVLKTFEDNRMLELCTPVIFANIKIVSFLKKNLGLDSSLHGIDNLGQMVLGKINVLNVWKEGVNIEYGKNDEVVGKYSIKSFQSATKALKEGLVDVLVTAPINKYNIQSEEFKFPGHTDYLNSQLNGDALMLMVHDKFRVGLLTDHIPVNEVSKHLTEDLLVEKINTIIKSLEQDFGVVKPKVALLGLNPHSGDNGVIGDEEEKVIKPVVKKMFDSGKMVFGPYSSDSFFGSYQYEKYDAILAMYHDQGLIPFKTLSFGKGVNYTAGLDKIRTSPDHGTAYEIAGKRLANYDSFKEAVYLAIDVFNKRKEYQELTKKPLKVR